MIIPQNSYIRHLSEVVNPRQILVFDGIRYSIDICDLAYERLCSNLHKFTYTNDKTSPSFPLIFSDICTIINNAYLFFQLLIKHFKLKKEDSFFKEISKIEYFRHTIQHLEDRIDEFLFDNNLPIFGILSWYAKINPASLEGKIITVYSGTFTSKEEVKVDIVNPIGKKNNKIINDIEYTLVVRIDNKFETKKIKINELILNLSLIIEYIEKQLNEQFKNFESRIKHSCDLTFVFDFEEIYN